MSAAFDFFPAPSQMPISRIAPRVLPGTTEETEKALLEVLVDNHEKHHIFFSDAGQHKLRRPLYQHVYPLTLGVATFHIMP